MRKEWNWFLTVATVVVRNANVAIVAPEVGSCGVCVRRESGDRRSVLCWCVWQECGFGRREDVFTFNAIYTCFTFSAICKDNAAINCLLLNTGGSFPWTLTGHATKVLESKYVISFCKLLSHQLSVFSKFLPYFLPESSVSVPLF
jgi:hypothetical protein